MYAENLHRFRRRRWREPQNVEVTGTHEINMRKKRFTLRQSKSIQLIDDLEGIIYCIRLVCCFHLIRVGTFRNHPKEMPPAALFFMILSLAPAAGFEPATNALHFIPYFRTGVDYIFTIFIK